MNMANDGAKYGVDQYRFAHNYDLKSKSFTVTADDVKYTLTIMDRKKLMFGSTKGEESFDYECLKIEADTYFILFGSNVAVIELARGMATLILQEGYIFGAVDIPGRMALVNFHSLSEDVVGTAVRWVLGCDKYVNHIYLSKDNCRAAWSPEGEIFSDYAAKYVKIKDGIYLVDVTGPIPDSAHAPSGSNRMIALQDYDHMMFVGCIFRGESPMMISGYGEFPEFDPKLLT